MPLDIPFNVRLRPWDELKRTLPPAERLETLASDGQRLELFRVRPKAGPARGAVLLLHGLSANRFAFHWPGRSVAEYLADHGFDCYVAELRGAGVIPPSFTTFTFFDYLERDVPALLELARRTSGFPRVHFVGHSMGGSLMLCHALVTGGAGLASGVALASALDYTAGGSGFEPLLKLRPLLERMTSVPWGGVMKALAPVLGVVNDPLVRFNFNPENAEASLVRAVYMNVFTSLPVSLLSSLSTNFEPGGLRSREGVRYLSLRAGLDLPILLMGASDDQQCPMPALDQTADALKTQVLRFGRKYGQRLDYGHFDLVLGRTAPEDVWAPLEQWLGAPAR